MDIVSLILILILTSQALLCTIWFLNTRVSWIRPLLSTFSMQDRVSCIQLILVYKIPHRRAREQKYIAYNYQNKLWNQHDAYLIRLARSTTRFLETLKITEPDKDQACIQETITLSSRALHQNLIVISFQFTRSCIGVVRSDILPDVAWH